MKLENERYEVTFTTKGGEIASFTDKQSGIQYMWQGDDAWWGGKNPTLFPMVGNTWSKDYEIDGKRYAMKNHGLIRYATLQLKTQDERRLIMELDSNEETLSQYPFAFHYEIHYELQDGKLNIRYIITNTDDRTMPFSFGLHPGFRCPLCDDEQFEDYTISFSNQEHMQQLICTPGVDRPYEVKDVELQSLPLRYAAFEKDPTLIYKGAKSAWLTLKGPKEHGVRISIAGYPLIAIWTAKRGAPFVCLEPWYGHGDFSAVKDDFYHREGTQLLSAGKSFTTAYTIEVF